MRLGLREANQRFSAAMRAVRAGEEVVITDRGKPFAIITPIRSDDVLARLERSGVVRLPRRAGRLPVARPAQPRGRLKVTDILREQREDR